MKKINFVSSFLLMGFLGYSPFAAYQENILEANIPVRLHRCCDDDIGRLIEITDLTKEEFKNRYFPTGILTIKTRNVGLRDNIMQAFQDPPQALMLFNFAEYPGENVEFLEVGNISRVFNENEINEEETVFEKQYGSLQVSLHLDQSLPKNILYTAEDTDDSWTTYSTKDAVGNLLGRLDEPTWGQILEGRDDPTEYDSLFQAILSLQE